MAQQMIFYLDGRYTEQGLAQELRAIVAEVFQDLATGQQ